jgi:hypothetical protein
MPCSTIWQLHLILDQRVLGSSPSGAARREVLVGIQLREKLVAAGPNLGRESQRQERVRDSITLVHTSQWSIAQWQSIPLLTERL